MDTMRWDGLVKKFETDKLETRRIAQHLQIRESRKEHDTRQVEKANQIEEAIRIKE